MKGLEDLTILPFETNHKQTNKTSRGVTFKLGQREGYDKHAYAHGYFDKNKE